jgi:hypothetical protein
MKEKEIKRNQEKSKEIKWDQRQKKRKSDEPLRGR